MSIYEDNFMEHPKWSLPFLPKLSPNSNAEYFDYHHPPHWTVVENLILANYSSKWGMLNCKVPGKYFSWYITRPSNNSCFSTGAYDFPYYKFLSKFPVSPMALSLMRELILSITICTTVALAGASCLHLHQ